MPKNRLLVAGSARMELSMSAQKLPAAGEEMRSEGRYGFSGGGKGLLCAVSAAKLGMDTVYLGKVGVDFYGNRLRQLLEQNGVVTRCVKTDKLNPTSLKVIFSDGKYSRSVVYPGAADLIGDGDVEDAFVSYPDCLLICADLPYQVMKLCAAHAKRNSVPVILEVPNKAEFCPIHELGRLKAAVIGEREIESYVGSRPDSVPDYVRASIRLSSQIDADYFVFRLGARGAYVTDGKYSELVAPIAHEAVDLSAAPEVFCATLSAGFVGSGDMKRSAAAANAAYTLCASKPGSVTSIPDADMLEEYVSRINKG